MREPTIAVLVLTFAAGAAPVPASRPELPSWMAGCWVQDAGTAWTEECWTAPRGGMMMGSGRTGDGERVRSWETMQIVRQERGEDGSVVPLAFWGAPFGSGRTMFAWTPSEAGVTFVNAAHDYPQRIRYWRDGDMLMAEIARADGGKPMRWRYRRM